MKTGAQLPSTACRPAEETGTAFVLGGSPTLRRSLAEAAAHGNHTLAFFSESSFTLELVRLQGPRVIVVDAGLDAMKDLALIRQLRAEWSPADLAVLVTSDRPPSDHELEQLQILSCQGWLDAATPADHLLFHLNAAIFFRTLDVRSAERVPASFQVRITTGGSSTFAYSYNLSRTGMYVRSAVPSTPGRQVLVTFTVPGGRRRLQVAARIVHVHSRHRAVRVPPGYGIHFEDIAPEDVVEIAAFVHRRRGAKA